MAFLDLTRLLDQTLITSTSAVNIVTNPTGKKTVVLTVRVQNIGTTPVTISLFRVPDNAGALGTLNESSHLLPYPIILQPNKGDWFEDKIILEDANDALWIKCSVANAITISVDGLRN